MGLQALKQFLAISKHFADFQEDQFDFHSYCMRQMTLRSYVKMLRMEDRIYDNPNYIKVRTPGPALTYWSTRFLAMLGNGRGWSRNLTWGDVKSQDPFAVLGPAHICHGPVIFLVSRVHMKDGLHEETLTAGIMIHLHGV
jgi:hypothetical protein